MDTNKHESKATRMGRPGLEPGTNPESFRGCSHERNAKIASLGFFFFFNLVSSDRALVIEGNCCAATSSTPREAAGSVIATPFVLAQAAIEIVRRPDVVTA